MNKKLIIFGVSGALLNDKMGGIKDVLVMLGKEKKTKEIDKEYQKRKIFGPWGMKRLVELYRGFPEHELKEAAFAYCRKNLKEEAREVLTWLKKRGHLLGVLSSNPQFITDALSEILSLDLAEGTQLEFKNGIANGKIIRGIDRNVKIGLLKRKIKELGFKKEQSILVSDSVSVTDLPMIDEVGLFVGFNARKEGLKEVADAITRQKDLKKVFQL